MKEGLLPSLSFLLVVISCLLAGFLLTVKTDKRVSNAFFGAFIFLNAVDLSSWLVNDWLLPYPRLLLFKITLNALINPAFYLYVVALCYADFRLQARHLLHLAPFVLVNLVLLPRFYGANADAQLHFLQQYSTQPEALFNRVLGHLQFGLYMVASFRVLARYQRAYVENYSAAANRTYRWVRWLVVSLTGVHVLVLGKEIVRYTPYQPLFKGLELWVGLNATALLCWWLLQALHHPELFRSLDSRLEPVGRPRGKRAASVPSPQLAVAPPAAPSAEVQVLLRRLRDHMEQAQPYLDPSLSIHALAEQLQLPVRELSLLINHQLDQHFFDFVNEYRIRQAMRLLQDPAQHDQTILEILYAVGFNSKSSFNTSFKKLTGQTPTQYRSA